MAVPGKGHEDIGADEEKRRSRDDLHDDMLTAGRGRGKFAASWRAHCSRETRRRSARPSRAPPVRGAADGSDTLSRHIHRAAVLLHIVELTRAGTPHRIPRVEYPGRCVERGEPAPRGAGRRVDRLHRVQAARENPGTDGVDDQAVGRNGQTPGDAVRPPAERKLPAMITWPSSSAMKLTSFPSRGRPARLSTRSGDLDF